MNRIAVIGTTATLLLAAPAVASAAEFEGTIRSVNRDAKTFRIHDSERGTFRVKVNSRTRWERVDGLRSLRRGMSNIEVIARRTNGRWVALEVERSGGGGEHGGRDDDDRSGRGGRDDD